MQLQQLFQLLVSHLGAAQFMNFRMRKVNHIHIHGVDEHFVVDIHGSLGQREKRRLTDEVLQPVVARLVEDLPKVKRVAGREQIT